MLVAEVKRLLSQPGMSHGKVATMTGVSRASVGAIASGRRPDYPARCNPDEEEDCFPQGPAERCRTCGGMVYMPCRLCRVRSIKFGERSPPRVENQAGTWALERPGGAT